MGFEGGKSMYLKLLKDILEYERQMLNAEMLDRVRDGIRFLENGDYSIQTPSKVGLDKGKKVIGS